MISLELITIRILGTEPGERLGRLYSHASVGQVYQHTTFLAPPLALDPLSGSQDHPSMSMRAVSADHLPVDTGSSFHPTDMGLLTNETDPIRALAPSPGARCPPVHLHGARGGVAGVLASQRSRIAAEEQGPRPRSNTSPGPSFYTSTAGTLASDQVVPPDASMNIDWNQWQTFSEDGGDTSSL